jgi:3-isopropylmalate/(R)-2-methylmalate dehydratase small subunit
LTIDCPAGRAIKYDRDNIDTDVIIPGQYLKIHDYSELATHAMEGLDPSFHSKSGSYIVAGRNFGCGSSREHAPIALAESGIRAVLALSFARIFYRNSVDGAFLLPIEIGPDAYGSISDGDSISVDIDGGTLTDHTISKSFPIKPFPGIIRKIIDAGGLFGYDPE